MKRKKLSPTASDKPADPLADLTADGTPKSGAAEPDRFLIAALGASAGGLEALEKFFTHTPPDSGIAFVVVMHLSPDHTSALPELLARCTQMTVKQVQDTSTVAPNCVYIIPPNATLTIKGSTLRAATPVEPRGRRSAIDAFFRSLAEES